jgi:hypothetical protein
MVGGRKYGIHWMRSPSFIGMMKSETGPVVMIRMRK